MDKQPTISIYHGTLLKGKEEYGDLLVLTSLDQVLLIMQTLFSLSQNMLSLSVSVPCIEKQKQFEPNAATSLIDNIHQHLEFQKISILYTICKLSDSTEFYSLLFAPGLA